MRRLPVFLLLFLCATPAAAQLAPIPPGDDKIEPVAQGQPSPFSGQLFDSRTALRWGNYLEQCKTRLKLDVELQKKIGDIEAESLRQQLKLREEQHVLVVADYQKRLGEAQADGQNPPFYRTVWFGLVVGIAGTALAAGGAAWAISAAR